MAESSLKGGIGHTGAIHYNSAQMQWSFERTYHSTTAPRPICVPKKILNGSNLPASTGVQQTYTRSRSSRIISQSYPALLGSLKYYEPDILASLAVIRSHRIYDPLAGQQFDVGQSSSFPSRKGSNNQHILPLLTVGGEAGSVIRYSATRLQTFDCPVNGPSHQQLRFALSVPETQRGQWVESAAPIRQVVCSQNDYFMIRTTRKITVLRAHPGANTIPPYHQFRGAVHNPLNQVAIIKVAEISLRDSYAAEHSHAAFSPWNSRVILVLNTQGHWFLYTIIQDNSPECISGQVEAVFRLERSSLGLDDVASGPSQPKACPDDGWGRAVWVADHDTVAIAFRKRLSLCALTRTVEPTHIDVLVSGEEGWIIDIKSFGERLENLVVLTSTRLLCFKVESNESYHLLICKRHFRDEEDLTMGLKVIPDSHGDILFIHSRRSHVLSFFQLHHEGGAQGSFPSLIPTQARVPFSESESRSEILEVHATVRKSPTNQRFRLVDMTIMLSDRSMWKMPFILSNHEPPLLHNLIPVETLQNRVTKASPVASFAATNEAVGQFPAWATRLSVYTTMGHHDSFVLHNMKRNEDAIAKPMVNILPIYEEVSAIESSICQFAPNAHLRSAALLPFEALLGFIRAIQPSRNGEEQVNSMSEPPTTIHYPAYISRLEFCPRSLAATEFGSINTVMQKILDCCDNQPGLDLMKRCGMSMNWSDFRSSYESLEAIYIKPLRGSVGDDYIQQRVLLVTLVIVEMYLSVLHPRPELLTALSAGSKYAEDIQNTMAGLALPPTPNQALRDANALETRTTDEVPGELAESTSLLSRYLSPSAILPRTGPHTARNMKHWPVGSDPDTYDYLDLVKMEDAEAELNQLSVEERAEREAAARREALKMKKESEKFIQITREMESGGTGFVLSQAGKSTQPLSSQALLRAAWASQRDTQVLSTLDSSQGVELGKDSSAPGSTPHATRVQRPKKKKRTKGF